MAKFALAARNTSWVPSPAHLSARELQLPFPIIKQRGWKWHVLVQVTTTYPVVVACAVMWCGCDLMFHIPKQFVQTCGLRLCLNRLRAPLTSFFSSAAISNQRSTIIACIAMDPQKGECSAHVRAKRIVGVSSYSRTPKLDWHCLH